MNLVWLQVNLLECENGNLVSAVRCWLYKWLSLHENCCQLKIVVKWPKTTYKQTQGKVHNFLNNHRNLKLTPEQTQYQYNLKLMALYAACLIVIRWHKMFAIDFKHVFYQQDR